MNDINSAIELAKNFYKENNLPIPTNVVSYISKFPPGLSRQVLTSKYNIKTSEFVKMLNPKYIKALSAKDRLSIEASRLEYEVISDTSNLTHSRQSVTLKCKCCGYEHITTITSLTGTKLGCPKCKSGNLPWHKRREELVGICQDRLESDIISDIPSNQTGYIKLRHICGTEYETQLLGIVSPNSLLRATCPNCRPTDRRVVIDNLTFSSRFEADCYGVIKHLSPELHVKYSDYLNTSRRWVCDFKIGNYWIEVSNFKIDYKNYFSNIEEKRNLVESSEKYMFFFVTSIKELEELISLM
jgi:predicted Zn-ribbon and HTH transcriptional regulator